MKMHMSHLKISISILTSLVLGLVLFKTIAAPQAAFADPTAPATPNCTANNNFLGILVPWYAYFNNDPQNGDFSKSGDCTLDLNFVDANGNANVSNINKVWLIGLAVFEDLLRIAGVAAGFFIIYGGIRFITSQGEPENTKAARSTIINALIGAAIAMVAAVSVSFIGSKLGGG